MGSRQPGLEQDRAPLDGPREQLRDVATSRDVIAAAGGDGDGEVRRGGDGRRRDADDAPALVLLQEQLVAAPADTVWVAIVRRHGHQIDVIDRHCNAIAQLRLRAQAPIYLPRCCTNTD